MYLTYNEFLDMGGTLDETAFKQLSRKAEYFINSQAGGKAGVRIGKLAELPQAVKDCTFDLILHLGNNAFDGSNIQSESQSLGGQSESVSYLRLTKEESDAEAEDIIFTYLYPINYNNASVLYVGCVHEPD